MRPAGSGDILIVGAGSAGSVVAERLSADPDRRVIVVEAGPGMGEFAVRALTGDGFSLPIGPDSPVVRRYVTTLTADPPRPAQIVRGACVGGSGSINGGYFCRALPIDFDTVPGWSWADVDEHYRAIERRIAVSPTREFASGTAAFIAAADDAGYRWLADLSDDGTGIGVVPLNIADGVRIGPGAAFLSPALGRANLTVLTDTRATRVVVTGGRAVGVEAIGPDGEVRLAADAVVLAAGAVESAHLLMLSGFGPAAALTALGIPVLADLPVGQRCWDHPEWLMTTGRPGESGHPVLEAVLVEGGLEVRPYTTGFGSPTAGIGVALMRPRARGRVSLASADPDVPPVIEHRYDSDSADLAELRRGCDLVAGIISGATELGEPEWSTSQHLSGTAPMGIGDHTVVDPRCRVHGVEGLWVVDGSVLPAALGRGPHATIAMIGHRAAEFIR
ncbi:MAG: mycofactocin system GMC family oxidoreductase MftG [Actinomycetia bacterium]|nr:mycofactocin system GMC family oxidoreductase MftG [Actinomycetes bacterium]